MNQTVRRPLRKPPLTRVAGLIGLCGLLLATGTAASMDVSLTEYQVKALFLFNFTKYVEWPAAAFASAHAPITIGVLGQDKFDDNLLRAVEGKTVNGRACVIKHLASGEDPGGCQILFVCDSEASRMAEIMDKAGTLPVLTVGEDEAFAQNGGIINFVLKNGNVRLEIDVAAAKKAGLTISSRLLAVADAVKGGAN